MQNSHMLNLSNALSLVIITRNRASDLERTLTKLHDLPEKFPIIVVDNASTDNTVAMVNTLFPEVKTIALDKNMKAVARNIGVEAAETPYVAFSDDDSWWSPGSLVRAVQVLDTYPKVGAVVAKVLVNAEQRADRINIYLETSPLPQNVNMPGPALMGFMACAVVFRKQAYLEAGGYNSQISFMGEEALLATDMISLGWGITYDRQMVAYHYPSASRDIGERQRFGLRNKIWTAWLRRPFSSAMSVTWDQFKRVFQNKHRLAGFVDAMMGMPKILRNRQVVRESIEENYKLLELQEKMLEEGVNLKPTLSYG